MEITTTQNRVLDAAQELVQLNGYNAFSYSHLSRTVGIKTASIHYYFPSKEDLGVALARRYRKRFNIALAKIEANHQGARMRIARYADQFIQTLRQGGRICLCGMLASDYRTLPDSVRREIRGFFTENEEWLARILEQGASSGELSLKSAPQDLAITFFSTLEGAMLDARIFEDETRLQRSIACWLKLLTD